MDFDELVRTRRTVGNYVAQDTPAGAVSDELVVEALRLSLWAPNHKLSWPWRYVWVDAGGPARAKLADLAAELKGAREPLSAVKQQAIRDSVLKPSHVIALGMARSEPKREHEDYATLACSVQIATMHLWAAGVATKWSTGGYSMHERTYPILGLDPETVRLEGVLLIGRAAMLPRTPERPPLENFLSKVT